MPEEPLIFLNHAAGTYPKPEPVVAAVAAALALPPREAGRAVNAAPALAQCRARLASLVGARDPAHVVLCPSATFALNLAIQGLARTGGHVVTTCLEHNSVRRPLGHLARDRGLRITEVEPGSDGAVTAAALRSALAADTCLLVLTHASNVTGCLQPVAEAARLAAEAGIPLVIDAAQTAGAVPLDLRALPGRVFLTLAGHKGLLGPPGTGALVVPDDTLPQLVVGGTGIRSEEALHPPGLPLRHEAGTPNTPGFAGLAAGVAVVEAEGVDALGARRQALVQRLRRSLAALPGVWLPALAQDDGRAGIVSFRLRTVPSDEAAFVLLGSFGIETRGGLHCAPGVHRHLGTAPAGLVRASVGPFTTEADVDALATAVAALGAA
jgi:selenocysteine lyase/cysteine desulfurase